MYEVPPPRRAMFVELGVCTVLVVLVSLFAL